MQQKDGNLTRRGFIQAAGAAGLGSALMSAGALAPVRDAAASVKTPLATVPQRPFGQSGRQVSILSLGGSLKASDLLVFRQAFKLGVTYWDTADSYGWGGNEKAIGAYFSKFPEDRKQVFLVTKAATSDPAKLTEKLDRSLRRMKTSYIDMYFLHYVSDVKKELTPEIKSWAEKAKASGKIRLFGFSSHKNMAPCLLAASKLGWVDGIMMSYNYRLMGGDGMKRAVDACARAGIGLTAMKTQAAFSAHFYASIGSETDSALRLTARLMEKGYTAEQARLRVVWDNPQIASICSAMPNMTILQANTAAAMNKTRLSEGDKERLEQYARRTAPGYCAGCVEICESAVSGDVPIGDILRYSMYHQGYGDRARARRLFRAVAPEVRANLLATDYGRAEARCPQNIPIASLLKKACEELA